MAHDTSTPAHGVVTERQLRERGVTATLIAESCRPGGPWRQLLPKVYLLHPEPPTDEQRLRAALLYAGARTHRAPAHRAAVLTGFAALALYGFPGAPGLGEVDTVDLLVPHQRRLRDAGFVRIRRSHAVPAPVRVGELPCAPAARALADAVETLGDPGLVRELLVQAVPAGPAPTASVVAELDASGLLARADVAAAVDAALARGRSCAEDLAFELVRAYGLPDPVWNVSLHLPDGRFLAAVDAYWPAHGVVLDIDVRAPGFGDEDWAEEAARRAVLEQLGITVVYLTPEKLRDTPETQVSVLLAALRAGAVAAVPGDGLPPVTALPR
ncbi:hypothetical protein [Streptomyces capparidis]